MNMNNIVHRSARKNDGQQGQSDRYDVMKEYDSKLAAHRAKQTPNLGNIGLASDNPFAKFVG